MRNDPILRFGAALLTLALLCAAAVAAYALLRESPANAQGSVKAAESELLVRSDPGVDPEKEPVVAIAKGPTEKPKPASKPSPEPKGVGKTEPPSEPEREPETLPAGAAEWPAPTEQQLEETQEPRRYASQGSLDLTVPSIDLYGAPVLLSNTQRALDNGVIHARGTSMPWSDTAERNVYLAGHRLGWPGTGSHLIFYRLNELGKGDEIILKGNDRRYVYRVTESFAVRPDDTWVMGRVVGKDMLTLQTCTPIPSFQKRLIVRAERV